RLAIPQSRPFLSLPNAVRGLRNAVPGLLFVVREVLFAVWDLLFTIPACQRFRSTRRAAKAGASSCSLHAPLASEAGLSSVRSAMSIVPAHADPAKLHRSGMDRGDIVPGR